MFNSRFFILHVFINILYNIHKKEHKQPVEIPQATHFLHPQLYNPSLMSVFVTRVYTPRLVTSTRGHSRHL